MILEGKQGHSLVIVEAGLLPHLHAGEADLGQPEGRRVTEGEEDEACSTASLFLTQGVRCVLSYRHVAQAYRPTWLKPSQPGLPSPRGSLPSPGRHARNHPVEHAAGGPLCTQFAFRSDSAKGTAARLQPPSTPPGSSHARPVVKKRFHTGSSV